MLHDLCEGAFNCMERYSSVLELDILGGVKVFFSLCHEIVLAFEIAFGCDEI